MKRLVFFLVLVLFSISIQAAPPVEIVQNNNKILEASGKLSFREWVRFGELLTFFYLDSDKYSVDTTTIFKIYEYGREVYNGPFSEKVESIVEERKGRGMLRTVVLGRFNYEIFFIEEIWLDLYPAIDR
ncbi:MAG: hypothetical protein U5L76_01760 [Patescibacteria group bacterium]|nr:hypothetical protein [Patescibacteria group bacterium]